MAAMHTMEGVSSNRTSVEADSPIAHPEKSPLKTKRRGHAVCDMVATESTKRMMVSFNERGQPIGDESNKLVSFFGGMVRKLVDINIDDWRSVPDDTKDRLCEIMKQKFILKEEARDYIIKDAGFLWRTSKSRLNTKIDECDGQDDLLAAKPDYIKVEQWRIFLKKHKSKKFQERRRKFKELRSKHNLPHTCSRQQYARLEAKMKQASMDLSSIFRSDVWVTGHTKKNGKPSNVVVAEKMRMITEIHNRRDDTSSSSLKDDAISQVFGPDHSSNRIRAVRFGVAPSKMGIISRNNARVVQLEHQVEELSKKVSTMDSIKEDLQEEIRQDMQESIREEMQGMIKEELLKHSLEKKAMEQQMEMMRNLVNQLMIARGSEPIFGTLEKMDKVPVSAPQTAASHKFSISAPYLCIIQSTLLMAYAKNPEHYMLPSPL